MDQAPKHHHYFSGTDPGQKAPNQSQQLESTRNL